MRLAIFGLSATSSRGNNYVSFWRALCRSLARRGHRVAFFERAQPGQRGLDSPPDHDLHVYDHWSHIAPKARSVVRQADAVVVTSSCADARTASALAMREAKGLRVFYDMDTPLTLERLRMGESVEYVPEEGLNDFDLVLSRAGGPALAALRRHLGARRVAPLYACADPDDYPVVAGPRTAALTFLGTDTPDREAAFERLLLATAGKLPSESFVVGGTQFSDADTWPGNVEHQPRVSPAQQAAFYGLGRFTLNLTHGAMRAWGHCPPGRLFASAACGTPVLTDDWPGLTDFFEPDEEIVVVRSSDDVARALSMTDAERCRMALRARERMLSTNTADIRAGQLETALGTAGTVVASVKTLPRVIEMPMWIGA